MPDRNIPVNFFFHEEISAMTDRTISGDLTDEQLIQRAAEAMWARRGNPDPLIGSVSEKKYLDDARVALIAIGVIRETP
jgi:hypothetical protein